MRTYVWACAAIVTVALVGAIDSSAQEDAAHVFVVAPDGDDRAAGTAQEPFKTPQRALEAIRELKRKSGGKLDKPVRVVLRGGTYYLDKPLELTADDGGTKQCPVTFEAYPGERPILSGGTRIGDWQAGEAGLWKASLPEVRNRSWYFHQLFTRKPGQTYFDRRYRPSKGLFVIAGLTDAPHLYPKGRINHRNPQNEFYFHEGDIRKWENLEDVEVVVLHDWSSGRLQIEHIDFEENIVRFTDYPHYRIGHWYPGSRNPYLAENLKEELGKPGEWYLDRPTGTLLYHPMPGEDMKTLTVVAPRLEHLLQISGDLKQERYVEHVTFRGLTFAHSAWKLAPHKYAEKYGRRCRQGFVDMPSAIELKAARHCRFERCDMVHLGSYAIDLGEGCHYNALVGNRIVDIGSGGVKVGVVDRAAQPPVAPTHNTIANNVVSDVGLVHYSAHGIWGGMTAQTHIHHNIVRRTLYSSVAVGWSHNTALTACRENVMEYNHVYDVLLLLDHGGALYTLGNQPGTVMRGNLVHDTHHTKLHGDVKRPDWAGGALGFDDGSSGFVVEDNIIYNTAGKPDFSFLRDKGLHTFRNNYFDVTPKDPKFPHELAKRAGLEADYRDLDAGPIPVALPPILSMRLPEVVRPVKIVDTFERRKPGEKPGSAYVRLEKGKAPAARDAVCVTDETASSGKHSLKIVDAPGLSRPWIPYVSYAPKYQNGTARVSFDLRVGEEAILDFSWRGRSEKAQFSVGPHFTVEKGALSVGEKELMKIPADTWAHVDVTARLGAYDPGIGGAGKEDFGVWDLEVQLPGEPPKSFKGLKNGSEEFKDLNWVGFVSAADAKTVFYLDNIHISNE